MSHFLLRHSTADNGDGTYRNPVLRADWSDPDAIRVGDDYYLIASSFHRVPGLPVLHSRDLVNWTIIGHALDRLVPEADFRTPQRGGGVWAPALRHHAGRYWIVYPDPDRGLFVTSAEDPAGKWTTPHLLKGGKGLIDPCPLWASDGSAYLVHGWAKSRAGINNRLTVHRMSEDATELLDAGAVVIDGDELPGYRTLEGPKFYERDGWYWIFAPAGGVADGWQSAFRSRNPLGPYEERIVLEQGDTDINGPHQGAWVTTQGGDDWFLHFQDKGVFGRVVHLQPMRWDDDGWPVIGDKGRPVTVHPKPLQGETPAAPATSDDFATGIGPQWAWQANPKPGWAATGSGLTLTCVPHVDPDLRFLPNLLGQRLPDGGCRAETTMRLDAEPGATAGLAVVGDDYAWIGLARTENGTVVTCRTAQDGEPPHDNGSPFPLDAPAVTVGVEVDATGRCQFFAHLPGEATQPVGEAFQATEGRWVGAALGLFATGEGSASFDAVRVTAADTDA
ncbi:glycoside hydrolase 43 family protein [Glycomyces algeriensis]|uniref:Beta-xylosidase n=1 Tax=Glycomyces algeriensis TaxID=256037 RepID=A0A9W6G4L7_9ACTN|nr:glycoside hydrolase 43 family protein [Glycomyces algeriensis]MDA1368072.1 glycoside hydrolase 43 family protein [Glycomyces algeriensis]MDR7352584.1 beta-xylosidase [Glycomyces algeriensis]GLI40263.1 beta-xylosidase [Glycomyces algeriensis]